MNKLILGAIALVSLTPVAIFASSDYSWGMSQQGTSHQGGGMGAGMITGSGHTSSDMESERTSAKGNHIKEAMISKRDMPMMGSGGQMGSGEMMNNEMKGLHMAIRQLSPADHIALVKMIKEYLVSKGIDPAKYADMRDDMKEIRKDVRTEVKDMRGATHDAIKLKQEEMRAKVKALRSSGKVNVQDISMMKSSGGNGKVNIHDISVSKMKALGANGEGKKEYVGHVTLLK